MSERGFLSRNIWRFIGILIIWATAIFTIINAVSINDIGTAGLALFLGVIFTVILLILITIIDRIFK